MNGWLIATKTIIVVGSIPQTLNWKNGNKYPDTNVMWGIARKIKAAIKIQNVYL